jgi:hypothetical protein
MPDVLIWTVDDFGAGSLGGLIAGTFVVSGTPDVARISDDDNNFDDFFGNGGQTQDPGLNQFLTEDLVLDGTTVGVTGDGIYNAAEGQIVNNTTGEVGRILYVTINGGQAGDFVGVATTIDISAGDSVTTSGIVPFATEPYTDVIACFTPGARIRAAHGEVPVEALNVGDLVMTKDDGLQPIRWIGRRFVNRGTLSTTPGLQPVRITEGSLGRGLPLRDIVVSPQHRMMLSGQQLELNSGLSEALIPALAMTGTPGISQFLPDEGCEYLHLLFDRHQILFCEGAETESFHPFALAQCETESDPIVEELFAIFPELRDNPKGYGGTARPCLRMKEARLIYSLETPHVATPQETISDA